MSWSPDLFIGEFRPWPDTVRVVRGKTDETRRYVPEEERDMYRDLVDCMVHPEVSDQLYAENVRLQDENARLRSCLSDDAENARMIIGENAKLRELVRDMWRCVMQRMDYAERRKFAGEFVDRMRVLEVDARARTDRSPTLRATRAIAGSACTRSTGRGDPLTVTAPCAMS